MKAIEHKGMFIPQLESGLILTMPQGGPIQYRNKFEAERHSDLFQNGYTGGAVARSVEETL